MDDPTKQKLDRRLVSLKEVYEVRYWIHKLGVDKETLNKAVEAVGHKARDVRRWLADQIKPSEPDQPSGE